MAEVQALIFKDDIIILQQQLKIKLLGYSIGRLNPITDEQWNAFDAIHKYATIMFSLCRNVHINSEIDSLDPICDQLYFLASKGAIISLSRESRLSYFLFLMTGQLYNVMLHSKNNSYFIISKYNPGIGGIDYVRTLQFSSTRNGPVYIDTRAKKEYSGITLEFLDDYHLRYEISDDLYLAILDFIILERSYEYVHSSYSQQTDIINQYVDWVLS